MYKMKDLNSKYQGSHPESHTWLGLSSKSTLVKVDEVMVSMK